MPPHKNDLKLVYVIYSAHDLLLKDALNRLIKRISSEGSSSMDVSRFDAADTDIDEIMASLGTLSFFGNQRLVVVNNLLGLKKDGQKDILDYLENPNPQSILVMTALADKRESIRALQNSPVFKACSAIKACQVHEFKIRNGIPGWIKANFASFGKNIDHETIDYLLTWVGSDLNRLHNEIAKICAIVSDETSDINVDIVKEIAITTIEAQVFDLIGAVIKQDTETALTLVSSLLEKESAFSRIYGLLERQFHLLHEAKTKGKGLKGQKLANILGVSSGQAFYLEKQSRLFSLPKIRKALKLIVDSDYKRKTSPLPTKLLMETVVVDLCEV